MLSGRSLCDELIIRPEESYRLCCVVACDLETSRIGAPYIYIYIYIYIYEISSLRVNFHPVPSSKVFSNPVGNPINDPVTSHVNKEGSGANDLARTSY